MVHGLLDLFPVGTFVLQHSFINSQTAVHLKIKDSLRLIKGQEAVLHKMGDKSLFVQFAELFQKPGRGHIIKKQDLKPHIFLNLLTERIGTAYFFRAEYMV